MKNIIKTFGLLSAIAVIPGALAATSRVGMVSRTSPRLPSIAGYIMANSTSTTGSVVNGSATTYLADVDCIDNYTACIKGNDTCGSGFEDCTTGILLHAKMPTCLNVLSQCSAAGRNSLFGTSDLNAIATSATTNANGEVTAYTYPTAGSVLGQMVTAAQIENRLSTDQCVKKYTACLKKENVCGADFELCTDNKEFKKQALACDSTLARCQTDGKTELFGSVTGAASLLPGGNSRLAELITEGSALAVNNAVATCNKVTDQCILNACTKNPNKCIVDRPEILIRIADATNGGRAVTTQDLMEISKITTKRDVADYIRQECKQTIGSNRYCYMTVMAKPVTKESVLTDPDNVDEVFNDMYGGQFGRFAALDDKIKQITDKFDAKLQEKCIDTISSCAMRSCGSGIGSVCYKQSRSADGSVNLTKSPKSYQEVKSACRAIVDTDANCQYAAVLSKGDLYAGYMNEENSVFTTLYPADATGDDPIGVVASLNATLATSYNDAAIENMKKQCQTVALGCVKSLCGKDYENCYRNRTDIVAGTYNTGSAKLDRSMNKMGGIMDYNIVIGLCMDTVKNASICEEHLKVAAADWRVSQDNDSWDTGTVRAGWLGANTTQINKNANDVLIACAISSQEAQMKDNCVAYDRAEPINDSCNGVVDEDGCLYTEPVYQSNAEFVLENAGKTLFQELLADVEREAQAKYNAKLTKEQNICLAQNNGGIRGSSDNGSTFMWVKLKNNKIPKNYNMKGLTTNQFMASNDLYGSFCRARITVTSDDKAIQDVLGDKATAYFAVGDAFTCGSWIDQKTLNKITDVVAEEARKKAGEGSDKEKIAIAWGTVAPALVGGVATFFGANSLQKNGGLGGLIKGTGNDKDTEKQLDNCLKKVESARKSYNNAKVADSATAVSYFRSAVNDANDALSAAKRAGVDVSDFSSFEIERKENSIAGAETITGYHYNQDDVYTIRAKMNEIRSKGGTNCGNECNRYLNDVEEMLARAAGAESTDQGRNVRSMLDSAKTECNNRQENGNCKNVNIPDSLTLRVVADKTKDADKIDVQMGVSSNFGDKLKDLENACSTKKNESESDDARKKRATTSAIAAGAGTLVAGALGAGITRSVQKAKYENAANEAVAAWMEEIGEHIQCYLGTEEVGTYGDVVSFTIE